MDFTSKVMNYCDAPIGFFMGGRGEGAGNRQIG